MKVTMMETLWILNKDSEWQNLTDPTQVNLHKCLQQLALWLGENPMDINDGIDYVGVREQRVFLKLAIENIVQQYLDVFDVINVSELDYKLDTVTCSITFIKGSDTNTIDLEHKVGN